MRFSESFTWLAEVSSREFSDSIKCVSLNNLSYMVRPAFINLNLDELNY